MNNSKNKHKPILQSSRRDFCKNTALFTAGVMLPGMKMDTMANVFNNKTLKLAVVGCGGRGTGAANQALKADENVELVAMADAFEDRLSGSLQSLQKEFEGSKRVNVQDKHRYVGFDAYKKAIDQADVVILATPPGFRPYHFEYAVNAGKHVFMEKPVATDVPGIRKVLEMAKIAKENKLNVVVGLQRHYQNNYLAIAEKIKQNEVGKILSGQVYWNGAGVWVNPRESGQSEIEYQMRNWYYFNWLCGDHILEQHIHNIDVANWFIGEYPVSAQGMGGRLVRTGPEHGEIFDHHFVEFKYPSGAVISSQCRHQPGTWTKVGEAFQGTKGIIDMNDAGAANITDLEGNNIFEYRNRRDPNPYQVEHDKLFASIRNKGVISDAENGAKSTMTAIMGRMATYSGQVINWEEALKSDQVLMPKEVTWESTPPTVPGEDGLYPIPTPGKTKVI
ncbi:dehydrogenase [Salegentibacter salinarum]|uniref:Dehydrogenase n=1 Tax=Salegentibacter salinarum TaxID=447422 RepID=A0A2N0TQK5_9FLAO|nr:Gfo/Idh/MocA family oxidoreductase [Salegentibacter salinarum]PKD17022.1 dehydrogenase [Salegentibacter salinarum]SKB53937.1 Predicted dehydrogenase [Salegentibacter salinarum]